MILCHACGAEAVYFCVSQYTGDYYPECEACYQEAVSGIYANDRFVYVSREQFLEWRLKKML